MARPEDRKSRRNGTSSTRPRQPSMFDCFVNPIFLPRVQHEKVWHEVSDDEFNALLRAGATLITPKQRVVPQYCSFKPDTKKPKTTNVAPEPQTHPCVFVVPEFKRADAPPPSSSAPVDDARRYTPPASDTEPELRPRVPMESTPPASPDCDQRAEKAASAPVAAARPSATSEKTSKREVIPKPCLLTDHISQPFYKNPASFANTDPPRNTVNIDPKLQLIDVRIPDDNQPGFPYDDLSTPCAATNNTEPNAHPSFLAELAVEYGVGCVGRPASDFVTRTAATTTTAASVDDSKNSDKSAATETTATAASVDDTKNADMSGATETSATAASVNDTKNTDKSGATETSATAASVNDTKNTDKSAAIDTTATTSDWEKEHKK